MSRLLISTFTAMFLLSACASSAANSPSSSETAARPAPPPEPVAPPEAEAEEEVTGYRVATTPEWKGAVTEEGIKLVHFPNGSSEPDGDLQIAPVPAEGQTPVAHANMFKDAVTERLGMICGDVVEAPDGTSASFDVRNDPDPSTGMAGSVTFRTDPAGRKEYLFACFGRWYAKAHATLAPEAAAICASVTPSSGESAGQTITSPNVSNDPLMIEIQME